MNLRIGDEVDQKMNVPIGENLDEFQNNRYTLKLADENDNDGIVSVFESGYFSGGLSVKYLRNPDPCSPFQPMAIIIKSWLSVTINMTR